MAEYTEEYIQNKAREVITEFLRLKPAELQLDTHIIDDLGADSLAIVELGFKLSETFGIPIVNTSDDSILVFKNLLKYIRENNQIELGA